MKNSKRLAYQKNSEMASEIFKDLNLNHMGIIIPKNKKNFIESKTGEKFIDDNIQGVSVCFVWDETINTYKEFITKEGRAKNYSLGFNHLCFDIENKEEMKVFHNRVIKNKIGLRLTVPEPSPTKQCNIVTFYKLYGLGIFEFNILE